MHSFWRNVWPLKPFQTWGEMDLNEEQLWRKHQHPPTSTRFNDRVGRFCGTIRNFEASPTDGWWVSGSYGTDPPSNFRNKKFDECHAHTTGLNAKIWKIIKFHQTQDSPVGGFSPASRPFCKRSPIFFWSFFSTSQPPVLPMQALRVQIRKGRRPHRQVGQGGHDVQHLSRWNLPDHHGFYGFYMFLLLKSPVFYCWKSSKFPGPCGLHRFQASDWHKIRRISLIVPRLTPSNSLTAQK